MHPQAEGRKLTFKHDKVDKRDLPYHTFGVAAPVKYPPSCYLEIDEHWDQGNTGSCTGQGQSMQVQFAEMKIGMPKRKPSILFDYYNERLIEGSTGEDSGADPRDGFKAMNRWGYTYDDIWPFLEDKVLYEPSHEAYQDALNHRIHNYASLQNDFINNLKLPLIHGNPFGFGFDVYTAFMEETGYTGRLDLPKSTEQKLGGHYVVGKAYDDDQEGFLCHNSWSDQWGIGGDFWMSYEYILSQLCSSFWVLRIVKPV